MNWYTLDIDLALLFTFGLVVLGYLHWLALKKANDQNLFAMRIRHYRLFYKLCSDFLIKIEYYNPEKQTNNNEIKYLDRLLLELSNYIDESSFLFNQALYNLELDYVNHAKKIFEKFYENENITLSELRDLRNSYENCKNWMEKFLNQNKP